MTKLKLSGFTDADDLEYDPIEFDVEWRDAETGEAGGVESFNARPRVPLGVLFALEAGRNAAMMELIEKALMKKDCAIDEQGRLLDDTSSLARWQKLVNDEDRIVPGGLISDVLNGLYVEYTNRRGPLAAPERPTTSDGPSSVRSLPAGSTSTEKPRRRVSTSHSSQRTSA